MIMRPCALALGIACVSAGALLGLLGALALMGTLGTTVGECAAMSWTRSAYRACCLRQAERGLIDPSCTDDPDSVNLVSVSARRFFV